MAILLKIISGLIGVVFLIIGLAGVFHPAELAEPLGILLPTAEAMGNFRTMVGAHYVAMGGICLFAIIRGIPAYLLPIGIIEACMVGGRAISALNGEFTPAIIGPTVIELFAAGVLIIASIALTKHLTKTN